MSGRTVVVTGGTRGIGRALAEGYVAAGARVAVVARTAAACRETEEHLRAAGGEAIAVVADVGHLEDHSSFITGQVVMVDGGVVVAR
jgi:NAD(P)-dependent dehydrogenase (short-subunit alcohol dehydrogenase family)